jgi:(p)ppGpp synthase/HD superfamily hydrolase
MELDVELEKKLEVIRKYAQKCYDGANCEYAGNNYFVHIQMVYDVVLAHQDIFEGDSLTLSYVLGAAYCHDLLEDTKESYNDIMRVTGKDVADITLAVTDVPADNRLMKHLLTMHKTVKDYRAIILKMADILANATYSKMQGSSMYNKYVAEYKYRRPIFKTALNWYSHSMHMHEVDKLWEKLDEVHGFTKLNK